jgi:DNA-directed RNA polymerase subunit L
VLHTVIFTGEDPSLGNRLATILIEDSVVLFASCQLLTSSPQTPKFRLEIQLLSGAGTEAEQRETVHERITDALEVLVQQMGPPAHRFHGKWLDYIWDQEDDSDAAIEDDSDAAIEDDSDMATEGDSDAATVSSTGSMDSDALMALENSLFGYPPDRGFRDPDMLEFTDVNPADVLPELGSLFSPGGSLVLTETHGNVARPGIHYDRYLNYEDSDEDEEDDDDNDSDEDDDDDDD